MTTYSDDDLRPSAHESFATLPQEAYGYGNGGEYGSALRGTIFRTTTPRAGLCASRVGGERRVEVKI